jgi:hypothetical protein
MADSQTFSAPMQRGPGKSAHLRLPFDALWGQRPRHLINGLVAGIRFRGAIEDVEGVPSLVFKPAWLRDNPVGPGDVVTAQIAPEGPQRGALDEDIVAALDANPEAATFFDGLAQFYRKAYLTWIDGTKKRPEERARRIAEMVELLKAGKKQRS